MLSLYSWLMSLAARLGSHGRGALPPQLAIITDKARCCLPSATVPVPLHMLEWCWHAGMTVPGRSYLTGLVWECL